MSKKICVFGVSKKYERYRLWDPENKKIVLSQHVTFDETLVLKSTLSAGGETENQGCIAAGGG